MHISFNARATRSVDRPARTVWFYPFKDEEQTALFKDPVRTAL